MLQFGLSITGLGGFQGGSREQSCFTIRSAAAFCQCTSALPIRQGIACISFPTPAPRFLDGSLLLAGGLPKTASRQQGATVIDFRGAEFDSSKKVLPSLPVRAVLFPGPCLSLYTFVTYELLPARRQPRMSRTIRSTIILSLSIFSALHFSPARISAQLVGEDRVMTPTESPTPAEKIPPQTSQTPAPSGTRIALKEFTLAGNKIWTDTGITLEPGQRIIVTAEGKLRYSDAKADNGPEGLPRGFKDLLRVLPLNTEGRGALIAKIGDPDIAETFLLGPKKDTVSPISGKLSIGINQSGSDTGDGSYKVNIEVYASTDTTPREIARVVPSVPGIDNQLFSKIPRRISDKDGNPGDMVNFLLLGTENQMKQAFTTAGWVKVDPDVKGTILAGVLASVSKESYLTMPMSQLYLFDRPQDYGWAHAEPIAVVASRNHLRVWKAPFTVSGQVLWVGAATHDIGFERDQRNNGVTHKIDPDIDLERDYVEKTLSSTGLVSEVTHFRPQHPMQEAKTATGGSFHSNGQVLVLKLAGAGKDLASHFASAFCDLLQTENPDGGSWQACSNYLQIPAGSALASSALPPLNNSYRVLVVPGILSSCQEDTQAFQQGQAYLRDKHGMTVEFLQTPNSSTAENGQLIATYLRNAMKNDARKFIIVFYSKGSPDVQEALAANPDARATVVAHVTVSGAIGGSPIAEAMPSIVDRYASALNLGTSKGNLVEAFRSLGQNVRQQFLRDHPAPDVPSFSLAAVSDANNTSKLLLEAWRLLAAIDARTDGQILEDDAVIPGGNSFGVLRGDHLAVALNYGSASPEASAAASANRYPRAALFEAAVRVATASITP